MNTNTHGLPPAIEEHLKAGATDAEMLGRTMRLLSRILPDDDVTVELPRTKDSTEKPQKYVRLRLKSASKSAAWIYPYGRVELGLEHEDAGDYAELPCVRMIETVNPWRVEVTLSDAAAVLVADELIRTALAKTAA
ncbi:hypothetical protein ACIRU3_07095 [Streptomyces sp. NPDC101151]|uniref:hypothetical protein n=1 Tax=Streptomyces sp. NPDC101151 TaxID=3366115 RepID=UPI003815C694